MKTVLVLCVATVLLGIGVYDIYEQKRKTKALDEIVRFAGFIKSELNYRTPDFDTLINLAQKQNYAYIRFKNGKLYLDDSCDKNIKTEFLQFINRIGTTDTEGQLALCDEYLNRFSEKLTERKQNEKSKIQVNTALSVLSALCVIILSL